MLVALMPLAIALPYALWTRPWHTRSTDALVPLWLAFTVLAVAASGRGYPHYLIQMAPPFALMAGMLASRLVEATGRPLLARTSVATGMLVASLAAYHVLMGPLGWVGYNEEPRYTRAYYDNFLDYASGNAGREDYEAFFDVRSHRHLGLLEDMEEMRLASNEVFVWGSLPWIYVKTDLENPTRYTALLNAEMAEEGPTGIAKLVLDKAPAYVLLLDEARDTWDEALPVLGRAYAPVAWLDRAVLYQRMQDTREGPTVLIEQSCYADCDDVFDTSGEKAKPRFITGAGD
jgi:hypothetical protein